MLIKNLLLPVIASFVVINMSTASANNGIAFPPANNFQNYQYPPNAPAAPQMYRDLSQTPYVFGQPNAQNHMMRPPANMNRFFGNGTPNFGANPQQRQAAPYGVPNRNSRSFSQGNNNSGVPFSNNMMPFGNDSNFNPFSGNKMPFGNNNSSNGFNPFSGNSFSNPMNNMFGNNNSGNMPFFGNTRSNRKKAWGTERNIWPDFYTDFTDDAWDTMMSGPRDLGEMPGGWRFPYISMPDPVTVSDAITNQFPPIAEEAGNMADFSDWGVFD